MNLLQLSELFVDVKVLFDYLDDKVLGNELASEILVCAMTDENDDTYIPEGGVIRSQFSRYKYVVMCANFHRGLFTILGFDNTTELVESVEAAGRDDRTLIWDNTNSKFVRIITTKRLE